MNFISSEAYLTGVAIAKTVIAQMVDEAMDRL